MRLLNQKSFREYLIKTVDLLREPAGSDFRSMEAISKNRETFIQHFHRGLFVVHACAIDGIMRTESKIKANKEDKFALKYVRQIFRSINDSLIWILLGKDAAFKVERLSRGRTRGNLIDQNSESVIKFLDLYLPAAKESASGTMQPDV